MTVLDPSKIRTLIFLEDHRGTLKKFSQERFWRLLSQKKTDSLPAHAGKWIQFAQITVAMKAKHEPPVVIQVHYLRYRVAKNGRFDPACLSDHRRMGATQFDLWWGQAQGKEVLDATPHLELEKLRKLLLWKPSATQERAARQQALGAVAKAWKKALEPSLGARMRKRLKTRGDGEDLAERPPIREIPSRNKKRPSTPKPS